MKKVVIIGGGFAGAMIAKKMQSSFDVTLIDNKDYFEFTPSVPRAIIEPEKIKNIQIQHKDYLTKARFFHDNVISIDKKNVNTYKNNKFYYDYLIICSGSRYNKPFKQENAFLADRGTHITESNKKLINSKKVLIIGGGLVGVEIATEIVDKYKNKKIIIAQLDDKLIPRNNKKSSDYCYKFLKSRGVEVILGQKVVSYNKTLAVTNKKKRIRADMILLCTGIIPNSEFMKENFSKSIDEKGRIKVNNHLQVEGHKNVFSAGDVNNIMEEKTAQSAEDQAGIIISNIIRMEKNEELNSYQTKSKPMVISLGKKDGVFEWGDFVMTGRIPALLKKFIEIKTMWNYK